MNELQDTITVDGVELTSRQFQAIVNHIRYDKLKTSVEREIKKHEVDVNGLVQAYFNQLGTQTQKSYKKPLERFLGAIEHIFDVTTEVADTYISELSTEYASASVRLHIAALSGFYRMLKRWKYVSENPFTEAKLPKLQREKPLTVPDDADVEIILEYFQSLIHSENSRKRDAGRKGYLAIYLMTSLGLRIGALSHLSVQSGTYTSLSKGKAVRGLVERSQSILLSKYVDMSAQYPFKSLSVTLIQYHIETAIQDLFSSGKIKAKYHAHSFRHYYAVKLYKNTKDIYEVSRKLNHSSVAITQRYLSSIEVL